jgi:hypothetical protein
MPNFFGFIVKETPSRRITVTSSLNEISTDLLGNRVVVRGEALYCPSLEKSICFYVAYRTKNTYLISSTPVYSSG